MIIENIIITGRLYEEMEGFVPDFPGRHIKYVPEDAVSMEMLQWADAYVGFKPVHNFEFYNIRWVHSLGAGVDSFLHSREWKEDVILTRTKGSFGAKISEYCLGYMLAYLQHHEDFRANQKQSKWVRLEPTALQSQKAVIFGTGSIAHEIARKLSLFGVSTWGVSLSGTKKPYFAQVMKLEDAQGIFKNMDWAINTLPLTKETEGIFNEKLFSSFQDACFMNVGRGATVEEKALIKALRNGTLRMAVLDVFETEPLPEMSELWTMPNVILTPHIAAITSPEEAVREFVDTLEQIENNRFPLENQVDWRKGY